MRILQSIIDVSTQLDSCGMYSGIACDGSKIYVSEPACKKIHTYNMSMEPIGCISTSRGYKSICYDEHSQCFWGYSEQFYERIIKLNCCFEEIGYLSITTKGEIQGEIVGVSANCCDCSLLVAYKSGIAEVSKETGAITRIISKSCNRMYNDVAGGCEYYAYAYEKCLVQYFEIAGIDDIPVIRCCLEENYWIKSIAMNGNCIYLLVKKCNMTYLMTFLITEVAICPPCPPPHPPCPPPHPPCPPPHPPCPPPHPPHPPCPPCPPPHPPCPPPHPPCPPVRCWDDLCAVIHSIALGEAALSHILNAEGEKIQKGVKVSQSVDELLKLNDSVRRTIDKVAKLEYVLYSKLEAVKDMCPEILCRCCDGAGNDCCHKDCNCHCDCKCNCQCDCGCGCHKDCQCQCNCDCECDYEHGHHHGFDFDFEDMLGKELSE